MLRCHMPTDKSPLFAREDADRTQLLDRDGFVTVGDAVPRDLLAELCSTFAAPIANGSGGIRNVLSRFPLARQVATSDAVRSLLRAVTGEDTEFDPVRGILFDKTAEEGGTNWKVPYHQDLSIAVRERPAVSPPGYETWSIKDGVPHVQPPRSVLERLVTVRMHLDSCDVQTGALRVLSRTHRLGRFSPAEIARCRAEIAETVCAVPAGGAFVFHPLLLHASSPVTRAGVRRRVLHLEFAPIDLVLPDGIQWSEIRPR